VRISINFVLKMKDGHYSRPVWADDSWLAKYAGKTLDDERTGEHGEVSAEHDRNIATIGMSNFFSTVSSVN
jgi:hypothetical protein